MDYHGHCDVALSLYDIIVYLLLLLLHTYSVELHTQCIQVCT